MAEADRSGEERPPKPASSGQGKGPLNYTSPPAPREPGFFTIYKKGQGYWTRVGSVVGAVIIGAFSAYNVYIELPPLLPGTRQTSLKVAAAITAVFVLAYAWFCWWMLNKRSHVDFLIATDSEMKKVNWTTRRELIGSTKIVIGFMFFVALFLFAVDQIFGWLMYVIHVLKVSPWGT